MLEEDGKKQSDTRCAKLIKVKGERIVTHTRERSKANLSGHILCRKCLLKQVIEGKREGTRRRWRRPKHIVEDVKEAIGYWQLKEKVLYRTQCRTHFGRGCLPFLRQTSDDDDDDDDDDYECPDRLLDPPSLLSWETCPGSVWSWEITCIQYKGDKPIALIFVFPCIF